MSLRPLIACTSVHLVFCLTAGAEEELKLGKVEIAGLRSAAPADLTASVSVLDEEDLSIRLSPNPADQLRAVPGLSVSRAGGIGALTQVRLRGAEANHARVLFEGIDVSDPVNGETDFSALTVLPVSRIEVLRGAASSLHGSDALSGVILLRTDDRSRVSGMLEAGSFGTARLAAGGSNEWLAAGISGFRTEGVDTSGTSGERDGSEVVSALARLRLPDRAGWSGTFIGLARATRSEFDTDADFDGRLDDTDTSTEADMQLAGLHLNTDAGLFDHVIRASFSQVKRSNFSDKTRTDDIRGRRFMLSWSPGVTSGAHAFSGLVEYERETYLRRDVSFAGATNADESLSSVGLAGHYLLSAGNLDLSASGRFTASDGRFEDFATWHLGAGYRIDAIRGRIHVAAGSGVKEPTFTELYGFFPGSFRGNPSLRPEKSVNREIGWTQTAGPVEYSVTLFDADLEDEIYTAFNPDFTAIALNRSGDSRRQGAELAVRWQARDDLVFSGQATILDSRDDVGLREIRVPARTLSAAADWKISSDGTRLGIAIDHVGEQQDIDFGAFPSRRVTMESYALVSLSGEIPVSRRIALTARAENLLDHTASDVFGYQAPGAGFHVGLKLR